MKVRCNTTGELHEARKEVIFDTVYISTASVAQPVQFGVYTEEDFRKQFTEVTMEKVHFTKEAIDIIEAVTVYDSLTQSRMLLEEILGINNPTAELKEKLEEIDNDLKVHTDFLSKFIFSNATFED